MNTNITLDINHPEKRRVESFLNNADGDFEQILFDTQELIQMDDIIAGFKFKDKNQPTFVTVIFTTSYFQANEISVANSLVSPAIKWTINGAILFGVESTDKDALNGLLGFFAGRE